MLYGIRGTGKPYLVGCAELQYWSRGRSLSHSPPVQCPPTPAGFYVTFRFGTAPLRRSYPWLQYIFCCTYTKRPAHPRGWKQSYTTSVPGATCYPARVGQTLRTAPSNGVVDVVVAPRALRVRFSSFNSGSEGTSRANEPLAETTTQCRVASPALQNSNLCGRIHTWRARQGTVYRRTCQRSCLRQHQHYNQRQYCCQHHHTYKQHKSCQQHNTRQLPGPCKMRSIQLQPSTCQHHNACQHHGTCLFHIPTPHTRYTHHNTTQYITSCNKCYVYLPYP